MLKLTVDLTQLKLRLKTFVDGSGVDWAGLVKTYGIKGVNTKESMTTHFDGCQSYKVGDPEFKLLKQFDNRITDADLVTVEKN